MGSSVQPLFSVCIPVYNGARFIGGAIESVLGQSVNHLELLVVDNCSHDDTIAIVESYRDQRIRLVRNNRNIGMIANWNRCLELSRGQYVGLLFADDYYLPRMLEKANTAFSQFKSAVFAGGAELVDVNGIVIRRRSRRHVGYMSACDYFRANYGQLDCSAPSETIISRDALRLVKGFDLSLNWVVDRDLYLRIGEAGLPAFHESHELTARRSWDGNSSQRLGSSFRSFADEFLILNRYKGSSCLEKEDVMTSTRRLTQRAIGACIEHLRARNVRELLVVAITAFNGNVKLLGWRKAFKCIASALSQKLRTRLG